MYWIVNDSMLALENEEGENNMVLHQWHGMCLSD